jgi:hypothetical protein
MLDCFFATLSHYCNSTTRLTMITQQHHTLSQATLTQHTRIVHPSSPRIVPYHYALTVPLFIFFLLSLSLSFSKNFLCSSALNLPSFASLCSRLFLSSVTFLSSAFSSSSSFRILAICSSRVVLMRRRASGRKCAAAARWSGRRRK